MTDSITYFLPLAMLLSSIMTETSHVIRDASPIIKNVGITLKNPSSSGPTNASVQIASNTDPAQKNMAGKNICSAIFCIFIYMKTFPERKGFICADSTTT